MALVLDGNGTMTVGNGSISGLSVGGLPTGVVNSTNIADATIVQGDLDTSVIPIGVGQTWQNMTASRALLTNYTNSTGKPIQVYIVCAGGASNGATLTIAGNTPASLYTNQTSGRVALFCIVPNSTVYQLGDSGATIHSWWELR
jgi:hypothetical protein